MTERWGFHICVAVIKRLEGFQGNALVVRLSAVGLVGRLLKTSKFPQSGV